MTEPVSVAKGGLTIASLVTGLVFSTPFGIPFGALTAALFISLLNEIDTPSTSERRILRVAARVMLNAIASGFGAVLLLWYLAERSPEIAKIGTVLLSGVLAWWMPTLRKLAPEVWARIKNAALDTLARWVGNRLPPGGSP